MARAGGGRDLFPKKKGKTGFGGKAEKEEPEGGHVGV